MTQRDSQRSEGVGRSTAAGGQWYLEGVACLNGGCQGVAVMVGEEEEVPLEVHATVFDSIHQVQLLQVAQASHQVSQLVVIHDGLFQLSLTARVRMVPGVGRGWEPHWGEELVHSDPAHVVPAERQQVEDHSRVRGARDEVPEQVLQVPFKEHALPATAVLGHMAHWPSLHATALPVALVVDEVSGHGQWQVRCQVVQDLLLVLWEQLLQDGVVFGNRERTMGVT